MQNPMFRAMQYITIGAVLVACSSDEGGDPTGGPVDDPVEDPTGMPGDDPADDPTQNPPAVPSIAYCDPVADWQAERIALETELLALVNQQRSRGANCGSEGSFDAAPPLTANAALTCAARLHSMDMGERDFFDHVNPDGQEPWDRMVLAGYRWTRAGENISSGPSTAAAVVNQWMGSDGHCANIMNKDFNDIGAGHYQGSLWTLVFGAR